MKNFLIKNWAFIGWFLAVLLDKSTGLIEKLVLDPFWQNFIYAIGTAVLGYFWTSEHNLKISKRLKGI